MVTSMPALIFNYSDINRRMNRQPEPIKELPPPSITANSYIEMMEAMRREMVKTMLVPDDLIGKRVTIRTKLPLVTWRPLR